ncbi:hypothetical protein AUR64_06080 [Haloprofundus marisrubri]|uniref:Uncharacterized protein n=1 Tax=Haloprofundus marisrubri TaxID=1514971 RepID=A0A0W1RBW4_9EURY|nr:hypothetical protein [Haloprofundus marisrubri]KTG10756.1 hypothetical protein AUR64_06080 [Haloprofundus marisrubri]
MATRNTLGYLPALAAVAFLAGTLWVAWTDHIPLSVEAVTLGGGVGLSVVVAFRRIVRRANETTGPLDPPHPRAYAERMVGLNVLALAVYRLLPLTVLRGGIPLLVGGTGAYLTLAALETVGRRVVPR